MRYKVVHIQNDSTEVCNNNEPQAGEICELNELEERLDEDFSRNIFGDLFK